MEGLRVPDHGGDRWRTRIAQEHGMLGFVAKHSCNFDFQPGTDVRYDISPIVAV